MPEPPTWNKPSGVNHDLLAHPVRAIRSGGSAGVDMMHVARGRLDAYFEAGAEFWTGLFAKTASDSH